MQELWWLGIDQDAAYIAAQEAEAEKRNLKRKTEESNHGTYDR